MFVAIGRLVASPREAVLLNGTFRARTSRGASMARFIGDRGRQLYFLACVEGGRQAFIRAPLDALCSYGTKRAINSSWTSLELTSTADPPVC